MIKKFIFFLIIVFMGAAGAGLFSWNNFISPSGLRQETTVILPRGTSFLKSIEILTENKIISYPLIIKSIAYFNGDAKRIKAGEYRFPAAISPREALQMLVSGKVIKHKITFAEGLNVREIIVLLRANSILAGEVPKNIEEGSLLPETYYFTYGDTRASVVTRMQKKMKNALADLWEKRSDNLPLANKQQALILASIVEKETGVVVERSRVAAVFINRMRIRMRLQSDPTTVYGIEKKLGKAMGRKLRSADLKAPTPYNTYTIAALPPTPIANPSLAAIEAVLHPLTTKELYFVATGNGGHNFSSNLSGHRRNVKEYRARNSR